jgi:hypothetical protein
MTPIVAKKKEGRRLTPPPDPEKQKGFFTGIPFAVSETGREGVYCEEGLRNRGARRNA